MGPMSFTLSLYLFGIARLPTEIVYGDGRSGIRMSWLRPHTSTIAVRTKRHPRFAIKKKKWSNSDIGRPVGRLIISMLN